MKNLEAFMTVYAKHLEATRTKDTAGDYYCWPVSELPLVLGRMRQAIERGSFNKDSLAFKATCKELKIKHTYQAIRAFLSGVAA